MSTEPFLLCSENLIQYESSVITVHGLHGNSQSTWEARDSENRGKLDGITTLESDTECRVLHYGYDRPGTFSGSDVILEASNLLHYISNARRDLEPVWPLNIELKVCKREHLQ